MKKNKIRGKPIIWWTDKKLLAGIFIIIASFIMGLYGKSLLGVFVVKSLVKLYEPIYLITGISVWVFSWLLLFLGVFLVGWETVKLIQSRIHYHVKETAKKTYHHARTLPIKGYHYTKELHKKSIAKIKKSLSKND